AIINNASFANTGAITIPAGSPAEALGPGSPYPSNITVAGLAGTISKITVSLYNISHSFPDDLDILLVGPRGQKLLLMSDAGGRDPLTNATLTFDDTALPVPDAILITTGTYSPANYGAPDYFPAPAPEGPYNDPQRLSIFNGTVPNGTWSLYVVDDGDSDIGSIQGGWSLTITTSQPACCGDSLCPTITVNPQSVNNGTVGTADTHTFTQNGGTVPISYGISGTMP